MQLRIPKIRTTIFSLALISGALALAGTPRAFSQDYPNTGIPKFAFETSSPQGKPQGNSQAVEANNDPSLFGLKYPSTYAPVISPRKKTGVPKAEPIRTSSDPSTEGWAISTQNIRAPGDETQFSLNDPGTNAPVVPSRQAPREGTPGRPSLKIASPLYTNIPAPKILTPPQTDATDSPLMVSPNAGLPMDLPKPSLPNLAKDDDPGDDASKVASNVNNASNANNVKRDPDPASSPIPGRAVAGTIEGEYFDGDEGCGGADLHAFFDPGAFSPDPNYDHIPYDSVPELGIYEGKWNMCSQRPLIELGRGVYRNGVVPKSYSFLGNKNLITPGFTLFGDFRTAIAANDNGAGDPKFVWANRLNLDFDLRLTATERIHAFWGPLDDGGRFTRVESFTDGRNDLQFFEELDDDFDTLFFEGDLGYIWGGMTDQWAPFDLPFVAGKFPLLFQNGVWINDAVEGFAFTLPAKNSRVLNWSNFDLTVFFLFDDIDSGAFAGDDNAADAYGFNLFVEAYGGYTEAGYAYLEDRAGLGRSYHNLTVGFTRRYRQRLSNSIRVIVNSGQDPDNGVKTADGQILIIENSLVSSNPTYFVPYFNMFAGFGTPQNLAGQAVLQNVGINFETDALTGFPKLDDRGQDTWGGAFGFNLLGPRFSWQWILEASMVQNFGDRLAGDQYAVGTRIQKSLNYAWLARLDAMYGLRENDNDIAGVRAELRWKF